MALAKPIWRTRVVFQECVNPCISVYWWKYAGDAELELMYGVKNVELIVIEISLHCISHSHLETPIDNRVCYYPVITFLISYSETTHFIRKKHMHL